MANDRGRRNIFFLHNIFLHNQFLHQRLRNKRTVSERLIQAYKALNRSLLKSQTGWAFRWFWPLLCYLLQHLPPRTWQTFNSPGLILLSSFKTALLQLLMFRMLKAISLPPEMLPFPQVITAPKANTFIYSAYQVPVTVLGSNVCMHTYSMLTLYVLIIIAYLI